jgi:hypothetical protein
MGLSGGIGVGMRWAIACDRGSSVGVSRFGGAIAIEIRSLAKILPNPHRLIVKFYELPSRDPFSSLLDLTRLGLRYSLGCDRPPSDRNQGTAVCLHQHQGQKSGRVRTSPQSFPLFPLLPLPLDSVKIQIS